jgi:hypothetical protein
MTPERQKQVEAAMQRANEVRLGRAKVKRGIRRGELDPCAVLRVEEKVLLELELGDDPNILLGMPVLDILIAIPRFGPVRAQRLMSRYARTAGWMSPSVRLDALSVTRRASLASALERTLHGHAVAA